MTNDDLKVILQRFTELMELPASQVKGSDVALCCAQLAVAIEDTDFEVPVEAFAELNPKGRKIALAGLIQLSGQVFRA